MFRKQSYNFRNNKISIICSYHTWNDLSLFKYLFKFLSVHNIFVCITILARIRKNECTFSNIQTGHTSMIIPMSAVKQCQPYDVTCQLALRTCLKNVTLIQNSFFARLIEHMLFLFVIIFENATQ